MSNQIPNPQAIDSDAFNGVKRPGESYRWKTDVEPLVAVLLAFYRRAHDLGWTTPEMDDARALLHKYAPLEVWP
ncbi:MAG: hypothetical protein AB7I13_05965 [Vicinamibacterales bacterium]